MMISRRLAPVVTLGLFFWSGLADLVLVPQDWYGAARAGSGADDDSSSSGSGSSGSGSGNSGSGSSGSGSSGSGSSGSGSSGSGSSGSGSGGGGSGRADAASGDWASANGFDADTIQLTFSDGSVERIRGNRYVRIDGQGKLRLNRLATSGDVARLHSLSAQVGNGQSRGNVESVVIVDLLDDAVRVQDVRGWRELLARGTYLLTDPNGRTVKRRDVRDRDIRRILAILGQR